ncbi:hypothetical protein MSAN_00278000 [Mycena sanguinolenta]|uniref:Uncharacterized protein n=1 Tax=Mycena sanguinolenta TaxID=230812 RepID=A0A8H7DKA7_9AGAR|nr:hypothetical protein MSAN_00278000 [Mycena sanguinolenta]
MKIRLPSIFYTRRQLLSYHAAQQAGGEWVGVQEATCGMPSVAPSCLIIPRSAPPPPGRSYDNVTISTAPDVPGCASASRRWRVRLGLIRVLPDCAAVLHPPHWDRARLSTLPVICATPLPPRQPQYDISPRASAVFPQVVVLIFIFKILWKMTRISASRTPRRIAQTNFHSIERTLSFSFLFSFGNSSTAALRPLGF